MNKKISIDIWRGEWRCGDGCCSQLWFNAEVTNKETGKIIQTEENWCDREELLEFIIKVCITDHGVTRDEIEFEAEE